MTSPETGFWLSEARLLLLLLVVDLFELVEVVLFCLLSGGWGVAVELCFLLIGWEWGSVAGRVEALLMFDLKQEEIILFSFNSMLHFCKSDVFVKSMYFC